MSALPVPPRAVPRSLALATWRGFGWLAATAFALALALLAGRCALDGGRTPRADWHLDQDPALVDGEVLAREADGDAARVRFAYEAPGRARREDWSWTRGEGPQPGARTAVEYLPAAPETARLQGLHRSRLTLDWDRTAPLLLSLLLACGVWLARCYQTWVVLRHGDAARVRIERVQRRPLGQLAVQFAFVDGLDQPRRATQWCSAHGALGQAVVAADAGDTLCVIHARARPRQCRLVRRADVPESDA